MSGPFEGKISVDIRDSVPDRSPCEPPRAAEGAASVVYVVLDDARFSPMGCYGGPIETPNIDRIVGDGMRYTQFHAQALRSPTRSCCADRTYPHAQRPGVHHRGGPRVSQRRPGHARAR